jgi:hypothetical protein
VGDEEMLDGQGGMAESNMMPDNEMVIKELSHVLLVSNNHIIDMGSWKEEGLFSRSLTVFHNFLGLDQQRENCSLK